ncbi:hypothetical protein ACG33_12320 [Steroidobacter denitrificans]|uniref:TonB-dependent receptor n=1 Tax=Steroidobacter denitrificans TaxID=465721 RepID=A0A127FDW2_STEDE|nr:TonB-dependent receptor [Steroidobacter denitrificans]AMN47869.1 hypothetical protein ACG33_12320 [Steroidobacter denitrificans]
MKRAIRADYRVAMTALCAALDGVLGVAEAQTAEDQSVEVVIVTGSRIQQNEFDAPTPTISLSSAAIELSGTTNLTDLLRSRPALVGSKDSTQTTNDFIGSNGLNLLNLRNLGKDRTLVLVDGRRHVAQLPETAAVDINTIPADLVERIDIVTGGVSAIYGADAVSGVVNFVMRKNFEGLVGRLQYGSADAGNPGDLQASLTGGFNFANGRGNLSGSIQHTREGRLRASDRSYLRGANYTTMRRNPDDFPDDPNVPDQIPTNDLRYDSSSREGAIDIDIDEEDEGRYIADLRPDGTAYDLGVFIPPYFAQGGTGTPVADYIGDLRSKNENTIGSLFLNFELNPSVNLFAETKFARGTAVGFYQPTYDFDLFFTPDNPYISPALAAQIQPEGFFVTRDNFDLGVRGEDNTRETIRTVLGINGGFLDGYSYEVSYVYGQTEIDSLAINNRYNDRFFAAIDVVADPLSGAPTCRSNLDPSALPDDPIFHLPELSFTPGPNSGCLPLNILGEGVATAAAIDWVMLNNRTRSRITQNVFTAFAAGPLPGITLPAGAIDTVAGMEWRRETSRSTPPWEDQAGLTFGNVILPSDGSFDVKEAFVELRAPILKDLAYTELLQLSGAARVSDYSTVGNTVTWNLGALWAPVRDISFRATVSESVRAPNIGELFGPQSQTYEGIDDPCGMSQLNNGTSYRTANCSAMLNALSIDPIGYDDPNPGDSIPGLSQGNAALSEETARSYTFGTVLRPRFAPGLALAIDYYDINIKNAISTATAQVIANTCVDQPSIDNVFCDALRRNATTGAIESFIVQPENVASYRTRGIDFNVSYLLDPALLGVDSYIGSFGISLLGSRLERLTTIPTLGADQIDERTTAYAPKLQTSLDLTWYFHGFTAFYGYDHFSKTSRYDLLTRAGNPDIASSKNIDYDAYDMHTLSLAFDFKGGYRLYAGVRNLTDERPDYSLNYPVSAVGRFYYGGFKMSLGAAP